MNTVSGVWVYAIRQGFLDAGINDGDVGIFSELMDSRTLALTANADTIYFWTFLDLRKARWCWRPPPTRWGSSTTCGSAGSPTSVSPGPDRGQGGTYLVVGPAYDGPLPEGGCYVRHSRTNHVLLVGRAFINENPGMDPAPTVARIRQELKIYPYAPGGVGSSIGAYLTGKGLLGQPATPKSPGSWRARDWPSTRSLPTTSATMRCSTRSCSWSRRKRWIPSRPASSPRSGSSRTRSSRPTPGCGRSSTRQWRWATPRPGRSGCRPPRGLPLLRRRHRLVEHALRRRVRVRQPAARDHSGRHQALPEQGRPPAAFPHVDVLLRDLHHPGDVHAADRRRVAVPDRQRQRRRRTLRRREDLPGEAAQGHPGGPVLVPQPVRQPDPLPAADPSALSRAGSQEYPSPAAEAEADGSTVIYFSPSQPDNVAPGNWIQTDPEKGWFTILRCYSPLQPFFDKTWRAGEIEPVT